MRFLMRREIMKNSPFRKVGFENFDRPSSNHPCTRLPIQVVQEKTVVRTEIKAHPLSGVGGMTMSTVQGGTIGGTRGLAGASTSAAAASGLLKSIPGPKPLSAPAKAAGAAVGQKRKAMEESMDPEKLARLKKEEAEALARREAAKARLNQRQASFFGMGKTT